MNRDNLTNYLRIDRWPTVWCPGCGNGIIMKSFIQAVHELNLEKDRVAVVSGIGCSSRVTGYLDFNTLHTLHGRAIAFATGVKLAKPDFKVIVMGGDGDITAIGGNHFIHACRRNIDLTVIIFNNMIYGMTGGQHSPTTPQKKIASTMPYGNIENSFDIVNLALSTGATYVARSTVYHYPMTVKFIKEAINHKGMSVVEVLTNCHTYYGRYNGMKNAWDIHNFMKENAILKSKADNMDEKDLKDKIIIGVFKKEEKPDFYSKYKKVVAISKNSEV
ncbi:2-oxoacid:ferredoxin oxidoreductase subunit beta [Thermosipho melanesiensis]|uniref:Thiamine pyrophosphate enzyme domain protein TPP-binding n=2 Tax=Thermosipho melanesiensis TaxID=46541 RepID=A6LNV5_THEM4|nr:2-oxoacid:ferredoxin oxidoreductase subunit beta [Thermosipho melanesiensis]ABR31606.1 thiamine pyrophosphate enzyme domain protein TPP-binding [Thermosipho melanesiensis BI429]APT74637.1 2-oxoacid:ferredoxin oxidoreductase subunit beta [Thermosipho melanesiensis]OOC35341.1 2-oxoacid:ferredoxin oxidoreductase subunit beta [Thermosipho melanesiensis]OOC35558.1 2-oxoacid:ferredoxin oxidoreductase subunit beta [Thermosipho melanesiensis]OOC36595.1 2-oxoacid:ferredoxin oxidoreductase subunit be